MKDRKNPFLDIGFGEYKGIHRMPFALRERAYTHEANRQRVVALIALDLYMMAALGIIKKSRPLTLCGAVVQNLEGTEKDTTQAAHCVPRQLLIGTKSPQELLRKVFPERAWMISVLFAETDILPVNFNICDSRAERMGLNIAFRNICQYIIDAGLHNGKLDIDEATVAAEAGYGIYKAGATVAFRNSIERLKDKLKPKFLFPKDKAKWTEQLQITEEYAETLRESPGKERAITMGQIEGLIKVYKTITPEELKKAR